MKNLLAFFVLLFAFVSCKTENQTAALGRLQIAFNLKVGNKPLELNKPIYTNEFGTNYQIEKLAFYVSNVVLRNSKTNASYSEPNSYHLISMNGGKLDFEIANIPLGSYDQIELAIGVDAKRNTSIDQIGDLDPNNGMAWDWKTGYKFLSLEGKFFPTNGVTKGLILHIGTDENYKVCKFEVANSFAMTGNKTVNCKMEADFSKLFSSPNQIDFNTASSIMGGENAQKVAQNYVNLLRLTEVVQ
jgi:hypothetical protein